MFLIERFQICLHRIRQPGFLDTLNCALQCQQTMDAGGGVDLLNFQPRGIGADLPQSLRGFDSHLNQLRFHSLADVRQRKIIDLIKLAQDVSDEQAYGYEMLVRNYLSSMWLLLNQEAGDRLTAKKITKSEGEERLKCMMRYIQTHYMDKLLLKDIAYAANISQREALRTFRNHLNLTPFAFLMEYRLRMATVQLTDTTAPVSQIAYDCGFSSPSYFGKEFRAAMGCTPSEYRIAHRLSKSE